MKKILYIALLFICVEVYTSQEWKYGKIHIIGDSHAIFCFANYSDDFVFCFPEPGKDYKMYQDSFFNCKSVTNIPFAIHWVTGRTMYRVGRDGISGLNIKKFNIKDNDVAVFIFGGVDISYCHVIQQVMAGNDLDYVLNNLAKKYIQTILDNKKMFDNLTVVVMGAIPVYLLPHCENIFSKNPLSESFLQYQVNSINILNSKIKQYADDNDLLFLNINHIYQTEEGILNKDLSDGAHHIGIKYNQPIKEELISLLLNNY